MANFTGIKFNDILMPDFVRVLSIEHSILPPVSQNLLTISGKAGAYDFGNELGVREINIDIAIVLEEENTLPQKLEELSAWLYYDEPKKLVLGDNPFKYYMAKVTGDSNIKESFLVGEGTLTFICTDPYIYGLDREYLIPSSYAGEELQVTNTGNADTFPAMSFEITKDVTAFSVVANEEFIDLGTPYAVDDSRTISEHGKYALRDQLTTTTGWTTSSSVPSGTVTGTFEIYGNHCFRQSGLDFGSGTSWHGAAMQKPLSFAVQDFDALFYFRLDTDKDKIGRLNFSLLDQSGVEFILMQIYDSHAGNNNIEFTTWMYGTANVRASYKVFDSKMKSLTGYVRLKRTGTTYLAEVYQYTNGAYKRIHQQKFVDTKGYYNKKIAQVKLHTGAYSTYPASYMEQRDVVITNLDKASLNSNSVALILRAGDVLEIDNSTGAILKNGVPFYEYLNPSSSFIKLEKGANGISISPADAFTNGKITYKERSL